jgi:hypothetical protein
MSTTPAGIEIPKIKGRLTEEEEEESELVSMLLAV